MAEATIKIQSAPWVAPVSGPMIARGAVAVRGGTIVAVGPLGRLQQRFPQAAVTDHPGCVLTPALVNCHIHLELSHLAGLTAAAPASFTGWISSLLELRERLGATGPQVEQAAQQAAREQYDSGVSVLADIGNTPLGRQLQEAFPGTLLAFREYLGLAERTLGKNLQRLEQEPAHLLLSGHAPYSTHGRLLQQLKIRARALDQLFPIHTAEPAAEAEMLGQGRGEMVAFIRERGFWDGSFQPRGQGGSVHYLHDLGLLDHRTLCIHAIHVSDEEIRILAGQGVKLCLCPGSNRFLGTGTAPARQYLDHGLLPGLGTDSLASNPELSLWREMALLAALHPSVRSEEIFAMATLGGARALGLESRYGTLEPGRTADLLAIPIPDGLDRAEQVFDCLVASGSRIRPTRIGG